MPVTVAGTSDFKREKLIKYGVLSLIFLLILGLLGFGIYYYVRIYRDRDTFPKVTNTVDEQSLVTSGYQKISSVDGKGSIFVHNSWSVIDSSLNVYGDVLNGSNAYIHSYPNSIGQIDKETCKTFITKSFSEFTSISTFSKASISESGIKTIKNIEGCHFKASSVVGQKTFEIQNFYVFTKNRIYQIYIQYPEDLQSEKSSADVTLSSVQVEN